MTEPRIRAVRNPEDSRSEVADLVKTVAITSVVSSLVGVLAVAGGQALYNTIKRAIREKREPKSQPQPFQAQAQAQAQPQAQPFPAYPQDPYDLDPMPESLRMRPYLRQAIRRPRRDGQEQIQQMFRDFERRAEEREQRQIEALHRLERRLGDIEDDDAEESAA